jgi:predicted nuclease of predicted toxin-antitoxin system
MKLLVDKGLPRSAVALLCEAVILTIHVADIGFSAAHDTPILQTAQENKHVVVTLDADFHGLLALSEATSPSVIPIPIERLRAQSLTGLLIKVIGQCKEDLEQGAVVTVETNRIGVRRPPLLS